MNFQSVKKFCHYLFTLWHYHNSSYIVINCSCVIRIRLKEVARRVANIGCIKTKEKLASSSRRARVDYVYINLTRIKSIIIVNHAVDRCCARTTIIETKEQKNAESRRKTSREYVFSNFILYSLVLTISLPKLPPIIVFLLDKTNRKVSMRERRRISE